MDLKRLLQTVGLNLRRSSLARGNYLRDKGILGYVGENVKFQPRIVPLYPQLIRLHNNIMVGAGVRFITHDAVHTVLNRMELGTFPEKVGCIEVMDNVFIGADSTIMPNVRIGRNVIIGAHSLVTRDCEDNSVYAGIPARRVGSFEDYIARRKAGDFPTVSRNQNITEAETAAAWARFRQDRSGGAISESQQ